MRHRYHTALIGDEYYAVLDQDGRRVSLVYRDEFTARIRAAEIQTREDRRHAPAIRPCMTCQAEFEAIGLHNRMCPDCRDHGMVLDLVG